MKALILNNWVSKVASLFVAIAVWYLVKSTEKTDSDPNVIPGTNIVLPDEDKPKKIDTSPSTSEGNGSLTNPVPGPDTSTPPPVPAAP